jgi:RNA polymerase sigma factor (sigma-70 family)
MNALLRQAAALPESEWEDMVKTLAQNDRRASVDLVVRRYRDRLYQHALYIVKDPSDAYDAVQEVFIKTMREPRFFDGEFRIKAWLFRVTSNYCYNHVRDRKRRGGILETIPRQESVAANQVDAVGSSEYRDEVLNVMDALSREHREILLLRYYDDLSYNEIAEVLDVKLGTVMSRLSRARTRLGELIGARHPMVLDVLVSERSEAKRDELR